MRVDQLTLYDLTVFEPADFKFSPGLNVLIGANGTGKSHVLKVLYSILRPLASPAMDAAPGYRFPPATLNQSPWFGKLFSVFRPERAATPGPASTSDSGNGVYKSLASHGTSHFNIVARGDFGGVELDCEMHPRPYLLTNELSVAAEYGTPEGKAARPRFFCLGRSTPREPVTIQSGETVADLAANPILEEFAAHYDRNQKLFAETAPAECWWRSGIVPLWRPELRQFGACE